MADINFQIKPESNNDFQDVLHPETNASQVKDTPTKVIMTKTERDKLTGIATGANNYSHPGTHPASIITEETNKRFMTDAERTKLTGLANTTINGKTGAIVKADIVALGIPAQDTIYTHPGTGTNPHGTTKTDVVLGNVDNVKQMPIAGGTFTGQAKAQNNTAYTTFQLRNISAGTAAPSGGANGDIYIKYK